MGVFGKLFGKKEPDTHIEIQEEKISESVIQQPINVPTPKKKPEYYLKLSLENTGITNLGETTAVCPYCGENLGVMPKRPKNCPACKNKIWMSATPFTEVMYLVRREQRDAADFNYEMQKHHMFEDFLKAFGYTPESYLEEYERRRADPNILEGVDDIIWEKLVNLSIKLDAPHFWDDYKLPEVLVLFKPGLKALFLWYERNYKQAFYYYSIYTYGKFAGEGHIPWPNTIVIPTLAYLLKYDKEKTKEEFQAACLSFEKDVNCPLSKVLEELDTILNQP